jgi:ribosomal subunit interface protein
LLKTIVSVRHCEISDELRERAIELVEKIAARANRPHRAEILFDNDHNQKVVEVRLYLPRGQAKISSAEADDFRTALDRATSKLRRQLEKPFEREPRGATVE